MKWWLKRDTATLRNSSWCPQPIAHSTFLSKTPLWVGGPAPTAKGHIELMTDFQAGKIFDNLRTKEKEKGQRQVSLFWAWDDSKNVRNFSMLIIMAVRGRFRLFSLSWKYICCSIQTAYCGRNVCPNPYYPAATNWRQKKVATLKFSMCGCPCMAKRSSNISWDDVEKDAKYVFSAIAFYSSLGVAVE